MEFMNNQTKAIVSPAHLLGFDAPSRLRAFASKRPGHISVVATKHTYTWLDSIRLAPDSASGNPPA